MWFIVISVLLLVLCAGILFPSFFGMEVADERPLRKTDAVRNSKWEGPKTDERINRMMAECIVLLQNLRVPISKSICPQVRLIGSHRNYGRCCPRGSLKRYADYDYYIEISGHTLHNTDKSLRNTLIHELLHTVPDGMRHTGEWKKWARYVSAKTGYNIQRCDGDETEEDRKRLRNGESLK